MRIAIYSHHFDKRLRKFVLAHSEYRQKALEIINSLLTDPLSRKYKSHKLGAPFRGCYGVSVSFGYRIVYSFDLENVYFINIGSHDEVY